MAAFNVDQATVNGLLQEDLDDWLEWANEPVKPCLVVRLMPAIYSQAGLPDDVQSPEAAERYASEFAKEHRRPGLPRPVPPAVRLFRRGRLLSVRQRSRPRQQAKPAVHEKIGSREVPDTVPGSRHRPAGGRSGSAVGRGKRG